MIIALGKRVKVSLWGYSCLHNGISQNGLQDFLWDCLFLASPKTSRLKQIVWKVRTLSRDNVFFVNYLELCCYFVFPGEGTKSLHFGSSQVMLTCWFVNHILSSKGFISKIL